MTTNFILTGVLKILTEIIIYPCVFAEHEIHLRYGYGADPTTNEPMSKRATNQQNRDRSSVTVQFMFGRQPFPFCLCSLLVNGKYS